MKPGLFVLSPRACPMRAHGTVLREHLDIKEGSEMSWGRSNHFNYVLI